MSEYELLAIEYTELETGAPAILINGDVPFPVTSLMFVNSFVTFADSDILLHRLNNLSGNKLSFSIAEDKGESSIVELKYYNILLGHCILSELLDIMYTIQSTLKTLKEQSIDG
jgi:hypothetical protein